MTSRGNGGTPRRKPLRCSNTGAARTGPAVFPVTSSPPATFMYGAPAPYGNGAAARWSAIQRLVIEPPGKLGSCCPDSETTTDDESPRPDPVIGQEPAADANNKGLGVARTIKWQFRELMRHLTRRASIPRPRARRRTEDTRGRFKLSAVKIAGRLTRHIPPPQVCWDAMAWQHFWGEHFLTDDTGAGESSVCERGTGFQQDCSFSPHL